MRFFFLTIVAMIALSSFAQISSIKIESKPVQEEVAPYDSLENISGKNFKSLVGQTLFLRPQAKAKEKGFYANLALLTTPSVTDYDTYRYMPHKYNPYTFVDYSKVNSKYFEVLDVFGPRKGKFRDYYFMKLREKESGDTLYYRPSGIISLDFVVVGYYEKMKAMMTGTKLVYKFNSSSARTYPLYSLQDGKEFSQTIPDKTIFECKDVSFVEDNYYSMVFVLHHDIYGDLYMKEDGFKKQFVTYDKFLEEQKADQQRKKQLIAKYGQRNGQLIFDGKVRVGFSKAMCKEAWGEPDDINTTTGSWGVHEQWVYRDDSYLYFENGKLTSIQN